MPWAGFEPTIPATNRPRPGLGFVARGNPWGGGGGRQRIMFEGKKKQTWLQSWDRGLFTNGHSALRRSAVSLCPRWMNERMMNQLKHVKFWVQSAVAWGGVGGSPFDVAILLSFLYLQHPMYLYFCLFHSSRKPWTIKPNSIINPVWMSKYTVE
jgi:hypothetical protein